MPEPTPQPHPTPGPALSAVRLDKWLWAVRLFKTRTAAADACRGGHVRVNDAPARAAREVRAGDVIRARTGGLHRTVRVRAALEHRIGAVRVPDYLEDLTPPEEYERARALRDAPGSPRRDAGAGRPTKRERRLLEAFMDLPNPGPDEVPPLNPG